MSKKKDDSPATFAYFAEAAPGPEPIGTAAASVASELSEEEQIAHNVKIFLEKRPASPWLKEKPERSRGHGPLALPVEEES